MSISQLVTVDAVNPSEISPFHSMVTLRTKRDQNSYSALAMISMNKLQSEFFKVGDEVYVTFSKSPIRGNFPAPQ
jgi:hypothetical protein